MSDEKDKALDRMAGKLIESANELHSLRIMVMRLLLNGEYFNGTFDPQKKSHAQIKMRYIRELALSAGIEFKNGAWILKEGE